MNPETIDDLAISVTDGTATKTGYVTYSQEVTITSSTETLNITLTEE